MPVDAGHPIWVDDDRFDIAHHVRLTALPSPGDRAQLLAVFERLQAQLLDRARPLWELWFVEGLEDGHVALIQKTHHALVDGVSGVDVATVLLDVTADVAVPDPVPWEPAAAPTPGRLLLDTLKEQVDRPAAAATPTRRTDASDGPRSTDRVAQMARSIASLADGGVVAPRTSLNRTVGAVPTLRVRAGAARRGEDRARARWAARSTTSSSPASPAGWPGCSRLAGSSPRS